MITLAILHSTIRKEEKLSVEAARQRSLRIKLIDIREEIFNLLSYKVDFDIAFERSVSTVKGTSTFVFLESLGIKVVNSLEATQHCADKFTICLLLKRANIPIPKFALCFSLAQAVQAVEELGGFPVVIKPPLGSWGRLLSEVKDRDALEAVLEHKDVLGTPPQKASYVLEFVPKQGKDIRAFVIDAETVCAFYRESPHWIIKQRQGLCRFPEPKILEGTNFCEIGFARETRGNWLVVIGALDKPVKGTAGNAVQCMNLMYGLPETTGLEFPGLHPV